MTATTMSIVIHSFNAPPICLGKSPPELTDTALHGPDARTRSSNAQTSLLEVSYGLALSVGTPERKGRRHRWRSLSFVHQVPNNGEEHEEDSDNGPNIDAGH